MTDPGPDHPKVEVVAIAFLIVDISGQVTVTSSQRLTAPYTFIIEGILFV